jgi:hypothetical protein
MKERSCAAVGMVDEDCSSAFPQNKKSASSAPTKNAANETHDDPFSIVRSCFIILSA